MVKNHYHFWKSLVEIQLVRETRNQAIVGQQLETGKSSSAVRYVFRYNVQIYINVQVQCTGITYRHNVQIQMFGAWVLSSECLCFPLSGKSPLHYRIYG